MTRDRRRERKAPARSFIKAVLLPVIITGILLALPSKGDTAECAPPRLDLTECRRGCDRGNMGSCVNLAVIYVEGIGVEKNNQEAFRLFRLACDGGEGPLRLHACTNLGGMYASGRGTEKDYQQSFRLFEIGCNGGITHACNNLAVQYDRGWGINADKEKASQLYLRAA